MGSRISKAADLAYGPLVKNAADATGAKGVIRYATSVTAATATLPTAWVGAYVTLCSRGTWTQFGFVMKTDTAPTLVADQASAFGTGHLAAGYTILADHEKTVLVPPNATGIAWISGDSTAGHYFEGHLSGPQKGR